MKKILALLSIFSILFLNFGANIASASISQYGLPGIYNSSPFNLNSGNGSALSTDQQGRLIVSPSSSISTWSVSSSLTAGSIFIPTSTDYNLYVATTGTDSGVCTNQSSPCKTLEYTFNKIPAINGGVTKVNIADGTYTVTSTYTFNFHASAFGDSNYNSVIKIIGNTTTPSNVKINAPSGNVAAFNIKGDTTMMYIDGIDLLNPYNGYVLERAFVIFGNIKIENYKLNGILNSFQSRLSVPSTATLGLDFTSDGATDFSSGINNTVNSTVLIQAPVSVIGFGGSGSRAFITILNSNTNIITGSFVATATSTGAGSAFNTSQGSQLILSITGSINNITNTSTSQYGAIITGDNSRTSFAGGTLTISTSTVGFNTRNGLLTDTASHTVNYNNVTTKAVVFNGGIIDGNSDFNLSASDIIYTPTLRSVAGFYGYDQRYGLLNFTNNWTGTNSINNLSATTSDATYFQQGTTPLSDSQITTSTIGVGLCNTSLIQETPLAGILDVVFPSTSTLFAQCLTSVGKFKDFVFQSINTSSIIYAGIGGTLQVSSSSTIGANKSAMIRITRDSLTTYLMQLVNTN